MEEYCEIKVKAFRHTFLISHVAPYPRDLRLHAPHLSTNMQPVRGMEFPFAPSRTLSFLPVREVLLRFSAYRGRRLVREDAVAAALRFYSSKGHRFGGELRITQWQCPGQLNNAG